MQRFFLWLEEEAKGFGIVKVFFGAIVLSLIWKDILFWSLQFTPTHVVIPPVSGAEQITKTVNEGALPTLWFFLYAAIFEEVLYRAYPIVFLYRPFERKSKGIILFVILVSIFFGFMHGSPYHILMQGVSGFILSIVFLKCGGYNGKIIKPFLLSTYTHFAWNIILVAPAFIHLN